MYCAENGSERISGEHLESKLLETAMRLERKSLRAFRVGSHFIEPD